MKRLFLLLVNAVRSRMLYKMLIIYSLLTLVPLILVGSTFYVRSSQLMEKDATEAAQHNLNETAGKIDSMLYVVKKRLWELTKQDPFRTLLEFEAGLTSDTTTNYRSMLTSSVAELLQSELGQIRSATGDYISHLYLVNRDRVLISTDERDQLQYLNAFWIMPFEFERTPEWAFFTDYGRVACAVKIYAEGAEEVEIGMLILTLDRDKVLQLYGNYEPDAFFMTNSSNLIVSAFDTARIGKVLDVRLPDDPLVIRQKSQYSDFQYAVVAASDTSGIIKRQALFTVWVTLTAWLSVVLVTYGVLRRVTNPVHELTRLMRRATREEYQLIGAIKTRDEIGMLCHGYNTLIRRTEELIEKNYKSEIAVREAELKAIRMYINPHFLYNTLEYISVVSQSSDKAKYVPEVVKRLSKIFRFSIMPGNSFTPLSTEISFVDTYLQIHRFRYAERLHFSIDLPDMLRNVAVPKLFLQPLVENAVIHGIDRLPAGGRIDIRIREDRYRLVIEIENASPRADGSGKKGLGTGLENVNARIRHHYGDGYGVVLKQAERSTLVTVQMPIEIWREENA